MADIKHVRVRVCVCVPQVGCVTVAVTTTGTAPEPTAPGPTTISTDTGVAEAPWSVDDATRELCSLFATDVTTLADLFDPLRDQRYQDAMDEAEAAAALEAAGGEGSDDTHGPLPQFWDTWCGPTAGSAAAGAGTGAGGLTISGPSPAAPEARPYTSGVRDPVAALLDSVDNGRCNTPGPVPSCVTLPSSVPAGTGIHHTHGDAGRPRPATASAFRRWERRL
jgi:hypothetical protein